MPLTRRRFLKTSALSALAAGCALGPARAFAQQSDANYDIPFEATQSPIYYFEKSTFEPYVGGIFLAYAGRTSTKLKLLAVEGYTPSTGTRISAARTRPTESFTLTFQGGALSTLSDVFTIDHAALGRFALLMTRHAEGNSVFYEGVINQFS